MPHADAAVETRGAAPPPLNRRSVLTGSFGRQTQLAYHAPMAYWLVPVVIVETRPFTSRILDLLRDEDYQLLQLELLWDPRASQHLLMLFAYPKNERDDLTATQRRALRQLVETEYP